VATGTVIEAINLARHDLAELRRLLDEQVDPAQLTRDMEPLMAAPASLYSVTTAAAQPSGTAVGLDLRTQDGRWWHLDASLTVSVPHRLTAVQVHARPPAFNGRSGGLIVCVFGPTPRLYSFRFQSPPSEALNCCSPRPGTAAGLSPPAARQCGAHEDWEAMTPATSLSRRRPD